MIVNLIAYAFRLLRTQSQLDNSLIWAAETGDTLKTKILLAAGANVHISEDEPIYSAVYNGHTDVVALLLKAGAKTEIFTQQTLSKMAPRPKNRAAMDLIERHQRKRPSF